MKLSVIIPCRNAVKTIEAQLEALCHQQWHGGWEVIVADNGSTDGTQDVVALAGVMLHFTADATIHIRYSEKPEALFRQARQWARYQVLLYKRYGGGTSLDQPWRSYLQTWRDLIGCAPRVFKRETRPAWMKTLGTQIGLLEGAIRYRVPPVCSPGASKAASKAGTLPMPASAEKLLEPQLDWNHTRVNLPTRSGGQVLQAKNAANSPKENESANQKLLMFYVGLSSNVGAILLVL